MIAPAVLVVALAPSGAYTARSVNRPAVEAAVVAAALKDLAAWPTEETQA